TRGPFIGTSKAAVVSLCSVISNRDSLECIRNGIINENIRDAVGIIRNNIAECAFINEILTVGAQRCKVTRQNNRRGGLRCHGFHPSCYLAIPAALSSLATRTPPLPLVAPKDRIGDPPAADIHPSAARSPCPGSVKRTVGHDAGRQA